MDKKKLGFIIYVLCYGALCSLYGKWYECRADNLLLLKTGTEIFVLSLISLLSLSAAILFIKELIAVRKTRTSRYI